MLTFLALCLLCRVAYTFNDVLVGELAREHDGTEIAAFRGLSLGVTMAPLLFWVKPGAWAGLATHVVEAFVLIAITAVGNVVHLVAARHLPFGLRAAVLVSGVGLGGIGLGAVFLGERFTVVELGFCALVVTSGVLASLGDHSSETLKANVPKGALLTLLAAATFCAAAFVFARLARATDPMLVGWLWEFGIGVVLIVAALVRRRGRLDAGSPSRFVRTGLYSLPTVVGTGAAAMALTLGPLGIWSALAGTQALVSAALGALWHHEKIGPRRWSYFVLGALGIAGLALAQHR